MKNPIKRSIAALLAGATLCSFAGCNTGSEPASSSEETTSETTTTPVEQITPLYTESEIAAFRELVTKYNTRAEAIATATRDAYITTADNGDISVARYYTITSHRPAQVDIASVWHYTAVMAMVSHMIEIADTEEKKAEYADLYAELVDSLDYYKGSGAVTTYQGTSRVTFYGVNRASRKNGANVTGDQAVYDDQMWIIMDLMDAYEYTGTLEYMNEAVRLADICLDGWDVGLDADGNEYGGITWGPAYATKHTCSNAPLIEPLVSIAVAYSDLGDATKATYYLDWAIKVYDWTSSHLRNSAGIFGDLLGTSRELVDDKYVTTSQSTSIDQTAYTYNTGAVLSGAAALYVATGDSTYLTAAERLATLAYTNFRSTKSSSGDAYPVDLYPITSQTTWFNVILLQGFIDVAYAEMAKIAVTGSGSIKCLKYIQSMQESIDYAFENFNNNNFLPRNYATGWDTSNEFDTNKNVMDQASAAESYAMLSAFYATLADLNLEIKS
ncbi:MAG: glycoside hydrolase family 76 protein [Eubacteriales bacterium]